MARGVKKPVEEKIREKREIIAALKIRIQKENEELEVLLKEEREKNMEALSKFLAEVHLTPEEAAAILKKEVASAEDEECVA